MDMKPIISESLKRKLQKLAGLKESFQQTNHHETGSSTSAANDLILYMTNTPKVLDYARKLSTTHEDLQKVFNYTVNYYIAEMKENPFELYADDNDGSNDRETVMYDFIAHYPLWAINSK